MVMSVGSRENGGPNPHTQGLQVFSFFFFFLFFCIVKQAKQRETCNSSDVFLLLLSIFRMIQSYSSLEGQIWIGMGSWMEVYNHNCIY
ncbi:unnamed protein product [Citrullus colocynthis]|uniref:Uncharacterized protein n=1 Tax=Citrullus colocynthis TaxID=252529 RepID=A0ABP0YUW1_9ROSI